MRKLIMMLILCLLLLTSITKVWCNNNAVQKRVYLGPIYCSVVYTGSFPLSYSANRTAANTVNGVSRPPSQDNSVYTTPSYSKLVLNNSKTIPAPRTASDTGEWIFINGDVAESNEVDFDDINAVNSAWGSLPGDDNWNAMADVDGSGEVDFTDINIVSNNWGSVGD